MDFGISYPLFQSPPSIPACPADEVDAYLALTVVSLVTTCLGSWMLLPHVYPTEKRKASLLGFATGTNTLKYYRHRLLDV